MSEPSGAAQADQETAWIAGIARGDKQAFTELYAAYRKRLFGYVLRSVGDIQRAEDLVHDVLLEIWKGAHRFRHRSKVSTWIFGIAHYKVLNSLRKKEMPRDPVEELSQAPSDDPNPEETSAGVELQDRLRRAITQLSLEHRQVIELAFFQGLSYQEIARIAGCPANTVKTRMFHAKKKLLPLLAELGVDRRAL